MIQNLNQLSFKAFGYVESERCNPRENRPDVMEKITLDWEKQVVYQAKSDTHILFCEGMTVLSVSLDGETFQSFYLDKRIRVRAGVYFCLYPFREESSVVEIGAEIAPAVVDMDGEKNLSHIQKNMHVSGIYTLFYHEKERGFFFAGESHPVLELTYVDQGTMHSVADGQELLLQQGDMVFYGENQWHMQYADMDVAPRYVTLSFEVEGGKLDALLNRKIRPSQGAISLMQQILRENERKDAYSVDMIGAQLTQLLLELLRHQSASGKIMASNSVNSENEIIRRAQQFISENIYEKLSVPLVAKHADVSPSYLTALFHKNLQISPGEYIRRIKIQESKQMIREGNKNFTEIAAMLQYSTVHHFSRQFKEKFGMTPSEYARSVR